MLCLEVYRPFEISLEKVPLMPEEDEQISFEETREALLSNRSSRKKLSSSVIVS